MGTYSTIRTVSFPIGKTPPFCSFIAECGFLSNYEEAEKLTTKDYQKQVAHALCSGILAYLEASGG